MAASKFIPTLLLLLTINYCSAQKQKRTYLVQSAYHALYLKDKKSFEPFKEIKADKNKWVFEFSNRSITFKKGRTMQTYEIIKTEKRYANTITFSVRSAQGSAAIIELSTYQIDGYTSNNIDLFELNKDGSDKALTKYVVRKQ